MSIIYKTHLLGKSCQSRSFMKRTVCIFFLNYWNVIFVLGSSSKPEKKFYL